ncbi:MAG: hypothetical protein RLZZ233_1541, partial [Verrucomicrobiota bacterium]
MNAGTLNLPNGAKFNSIVFGNSSPTLNGGTITTSGDFNFTMTGGTVKIGSVLAGNSKIINAAGTSYLWLNSASTLTGDASGVVLDMTSATGNTIVNAAQVNWGATKTVKMAGDLLLRVDDALGAAKLEITSGTLYSTSNARFLSSPVSLKGKLALGSWIDSAQGDYRYALNLRGAVDLNAATREVNTAVDLTLSGPVTNGAITKTGAQQLTMSGDVASKGALGGVTAFTLSTGDATFANATSLEGTYTATTGTSTFTGATYLRSIVFGNSSPTLNGGTITTSGDFNFTMTGGTVKIGSVLAGNSKI